MRDETLDVQTERASGKSGSVEDKPNQAKGSKRWKAERSSWEGGKEGRKTNGRVGWIEEVGMAQGETEINLQEAGSSSGNHFERRRGERGA